MSSIEKCIKLLIFIILQEEKHITEIQNEDTKDEQKEGKEINGVDHESKKEVIHVEGTLYLFLIKIIFPDS